MQVAIKTMNILRLAKLFRILYSQGSCRFCEEIPLIVFYVYKVLDLDVFLLPLRNI